MDKMNDTVKAMTPSLAPPLGEHSDFANASSLLPVLIFTVALCLSCTMAGLLVRLYTKLRTVRRVELDDYFAVGALVTFAAYCALMLLGAQAGAGRHMWDVSLATLPDMLFYVNVGQVFYGPIQWFAKACLLVQLDKLFAPTRRGAIHWVIRATIWLNFVFYLADTVAILLQCVPREKIWHPWVQGACIDITANCLLTAAINTISDWIILAIPIWAIWRLKMPLQRKFGVGAVFATGIFACMSSICRLVYTVKVFNSDDMTYAVMELELWTLAEFTTVFLCATFPLVPRFVKLLRDPARPPTTEPSSGSPSDEPSWEKRRASSMLASPRLASPMLGAWTGARQQHQPCCPTCGVEQRDWAVMKQIARVEVDSRNGDGRQERRARRGSALTAASGSGNRSVNDSGNRSTRGSGNRSMTNSGNHGGIQKTVRLETSWEGASEAERGEW